MDENTLHLDQKLQLFLSRNGIEFVSCIRRGWSHINLSIRINNEDYNIEASAEYAKNEIERDFILYGEIIERLVLKLNKFDVSDEDLTDLYDIYEHCTLDNEITIENLTIKIVNNPESQEEDLGLWMEYCNNKNTDKRSTKFILECPITFEDIENLEGYFSEVKKQIIKVRNFTNCNTVQITNENQNNVVKEPVKNETSSIQSFDFKNRVNNLILGPDDFPGEDFFG